MNELVDVLDLNGNKTGKKIPRDIAHKDGTWHGSIHIMVINKNKNLVLLQKRCKDNRLYPDTWDVTVGGHISEGEEPLLAAKREFGEELGLNPNIYNFEFVLRKNETIIKNDIISNEIVSVYVIYSDIDINNINIQTKEVGLVKWFTKYDLNKLIKNNEIIPHKEEFEFLNNILT